MNQCPLIVQWNETVREIKFNVYQPHFIFLFFFCIFIILEYLYK